MSGYMHALSGYSLLQRLGDPPDPPDPQPPTRDELLDEGFCPECGGEGCRDCAETGKVQFCETCGVMGSKFTEIDGLHYCPKHEGEET